jgi:hypothetical protein
MGELEMSCGLPPGPDFADLAVLARLFNRLLVSRFRDS